jgi:dienelactone hydrolase
MRTEECFRLYERLFHQMALISPERDMSSMAAKQEIIALAQNSLSYRPEWIPELIVEQIREIHRPGYRIELLKAESWSGVAAAANLYIPASVASGQQCPLIIICCGHGAGGKLNRGYQAMAIRLAKQGAIVLMPENIGQGERVAMEHSDCPGVFAAGLSVQGLIVMETAGWLNWAKQLPMIDSRRIGVCGNSGGGTLAIYLALFNPEVSAIAPTSFPPNYVFFASKEKRECDCNIIPRCVGSFDIWEVVSALSPRPIFINQGSNDNLYPEDLFFSSARKIREVYCRMNAARNFSASAKTGGHFWDSPRRIMISEFYHKYFDLAKPEFAEDNLDECLNQEALIYEEWPDKAIGTEQIAANLSGGKIIVPLRFEEIFKPRYTPAKTEEGVFRNGSNLRIFAQYEAFFAAQSNTH